jgi:hypothetical protein
MLISGIFTSYSDTLFGTVSLSAFYTPSPVVDAIADPLKARGVEIRKFLEPSAGQGAFVDSFMHFYPATETLAFLQRALRDKLLGRNNPHESDSL